MSETFELDKNNLSVYERSDWSDMEKMDSKTISLEPERQDLDLLQLSIKGEKISDDVLRCLDGNYKRIIPSSNGVEPTDVIKNLSQQEKNIYNDYLDDYRYLRQYVLNPEFKNKVQRASGLTSNYIDNIMSQIYDFFKYDTPQNELIINYNQNSKVNGRTISFLGKQAKENVIILYKEGRERHYGAHEISHLIFDEINKFYMVQPKIDLLDNNSFYPEDVKNYARLSQEQYPNIFQIRAKYDISPEQKITIQEAKKIINENKHNIFISNLSPKILKEIMNSWGSIYKAMENQMKDLNYKKVKTDKEK